MQSDEYHTFDRDKGRDTDLRLCRFCDKPFGDHEQSCPINEAKDAQVYEDLKEDPLP